MEGSDLIAQYNIYETVMPGGNSIVVSKFDYNRKWEVF